MSHSGATAAGDASAADRLARVVEQDWARMLATLVRMLGDVTRAEDALQDAIVAALDRWPVDGVPREPRAWLITAAKRRAIDRLRRERRRPELERQAVRDGLTWTDAEALPMPFGDPPVSEASIDDDVLRLVFLCCHPALSQEAQTALALRLLGGLTTAEIARAYLVPEATMAQRLLRAKTKIAQAAIPFVLPPRDEIPARTAAVASAVYLLFNEGYLSTSGDAVLRTDLIDEAIRLGELVCGLLPEEPALLGVLSLMLLQDSRRPTRAGPDGDLALLRDQDRSRWDAAKIARGVELLGAGLARTPTHPDSYVVQAAIAACHALAPDY
ncbi:MAG: sigma-70 family RNA polymerase sigma factor, partial [Solirubrobacteraceae bacterium]|nr:sigma-70 family RNA polymerase sigma factor [Solirubrobacteraceae bacterium]